MRTLTALGIINRIASRLTGHAIAHTVEADGRDTWHPWWHGKHVRGSWQWRKAPGWVR